MGRAFAEAIAINLATVNGLTVLSPPEDYLHGQAGQPTALALAARMQAGKLATGTLTRDEDSLSVRVTLRSIPRGSVIWGAEKSGSDRSMPGIAGTLARGIVAKMGKAEPRLYQYFTEELSRDSTMAASPLTWAALDKWSHGTIDERVGAFRKLAEAFPGQPAALAAYATDLSNLLVERQSADVAAELERSLQRLQKLDPNRPDIDKIRAYLFFRMKGQPAEAIALYTELQDRHDLSHGLRSVILSGCANAELDAGRVESAINHAEMATRLDPSRAAGWTDLSRVYRGAGRFEAALAPAQRVVALQPSNGWGQHSLGLILTRLNRDQEALRHYALACSLVQSQSQCANYATALLKVGRIAEAPVVAVGAEKLPTSTYGGYNLACFWAIAGDHERALLWLQKALDVGYSSVYIESDPDLASLRGDPRFERIIAEVRRKTAAP